MLAWSDWTIPCFGWCFSEDLIELLTLIMTVAGVTFSHCPGNECLWKTTLQWPKYYKLTLMKWRAKMISEINIKTYIIPIRTTCDQRKHQHLFIYCLYSAQMIWLYSNLAVWPILQSATRGKSRCLAVLDLVSICVDKEQKGAHNDKDKWTLGFERFTDLSRDRELCQFDAASFNSLGQFTRCSASYTHWLCSSD